MLSQVGPTCCTPSGNGVWHGSAHRTRGNSAGPVRPPLPSHSSTLNSKGAIMRHVIWVRSTAPGLRAGPVTDGGTPVPKSDSRTPFPSRGIHAARSFQGFCVSASRRFDFVTFCSADVWPSFPSHCKTCPNLHLSRSPVDHGAAQLPLTKRLTPKYPAAQVRPTRRKPAQEPAATRVSARTCRATCPKRDKVSHQGAQPNPAAERRKTIARGASPWLAVLRDGQAPEGRQKNARRASRRSSCRRQSMRRTPNPFVRSLAKPRGGRNSAVTARTSLSGA